MHYSDSKAPILLSFLIPLALAIMGIPTFDNYMSVKYSGLQDNPVVFNMLMNMWENFARVSAIIVAICMYKRVPEMGSPKVVAIILDLLWLALIGIQLLTYWLKFSLRASGHPQVEISFLDDHANLVAIISIIFFAILLVGLPAFVLLMTQPKKEEEGPAEGICHRPSFNHAIT